MKEMTSSRLDDFRFTAPSASDNTKDAKYVPGALSVKKEPLKISTGIEPGDTEADGRPVPKWKLWFAKWMVVWAVLGYSFLAIQAAKIYMEKNAKGLSLPSYIVYICGSIMWLIYGSVVLPRKNMVIIVSSCTAITLATIVLIGIVMYD